MVGDKTIITHPAGMNSSIACCPQAAIESRSPTKTDQDLTRSSAAPPDAELGSSIPLSLYNARFTSTKPVDLGVPEHSARSPGLATFGGVIPTVTSSIPESEERAIGHVQRRPEAERSCTGSRAAQLGVGLTRSPSRRGTPNQGADAARASVSDSKLVSLPVAGFGPRAQRGDVHNVDHPDLGPPRRQGPRPGEAALPALNTSPLCPSRARAPEARPRQGRPKVVANAMRAKPVQRNYYIIGITHRHIAAKAKDGGATSHRGVSARRRPWS